MATTPRRADRDCYRILHTDGGYIKFSDAIKPSGAEHAVAKYGVCGTLHVFLVFKVWILCSVLPSSKMCHVCQDYLYTVNNNGQLL